MELLKGCCEVFGLWVMVYVAYPLLLGGLTFLCVNNEFIPLLNDKP